jgi:hypothetical protein
MNILEKLKKINSEDLDELVHEGAAELAADANNSGVEAQVTFLKESCGFTDEDILRILEIE